MTPIQIPLDVVGEALVTALWSAPAGPLALATCHQAIFEQLTLTDQIAQMFPAIRVMEPTWESQTPNGSNPVLPVVDGKMTFLVAYGRTFALTDSSETWSRQLVKDVQQIAAVLWPGDMQIPGFNTPPGLTVKKIYLTQVAAAASPADEDLGVRIAEAQIRVAIEVQLRGER